jgi:hypothetical protein
MSYRYEDENDYEVEDEFDEDDVDEFDYLGGHGFDEYPYWDECVVFPTEIDDDELYDFAWDERYEEDELYA